MTTKNFELFFIYFPGNIGWRRKAVLNPESTGLYLQTKDRLTASLSMIFQFDVNVELI